LSRCKSATHPVGFLPKQIDDINRLAAVMDEKHGAKPTLFIYGFSFDAQFQGFTARLDAEVRHGGIVAKLFCRRDGLRELLCGEKLPRLALHARKREDAIVCFGTRRPWTTFFHQAPIRCYAPVAPSWKQWRMA
jgi:hypothetical protein